MTYAVVGLPRSGTAWIANWLTTNTQTCLHDPFTLGLPEVWPAHDGVACTGAYLLPGWLGTCSRVAVVERDPGACDASLAAIGLPLTTKAMQAALAAVDAPRWKFSELFTNEARARELHHFLILPEPFNAARWRQLTTLNVQTKVRAEGDPLAALQRYGEHLRADTDA